MFEATAREIMVPLHDYPHALETQPLSEAVALLDRQPIKIGDRVSMPRILLVFDAGNKLLGLVRRRDILRGLEPEYPAELDSAHPEAHIKAEIDPKLSQLLGPEDIDRLRQRLDKPLSEVVREMPSRVEADDSLMKVVRELVGKDTHIAAVLDNEEVIGVVRSLDLLRAVTMALS